MKKIFNLKIFIGIIVAVLFFAVATVYGCTSCDYTPDDNSSEAAVNNSEASKADNSIAEESDVSGNTENSNISEVDESKDVVSDASENDTNESETSIRDDESDSSNVSYPDNVSSPDNDASKDETSSVPNQGETSKGDTSKDEPDDTSVPEQSDDFVFTLDMDGGTSYNKPYEIDSLTVYVNGVVKDDANGIKNVTVAGGKYGPARIYNDGSFAIKVGILLFNQTYEVTFVATNNAGETRTLVRYFRSSVNNPPEISFALGSSSTRPKYIAVNAGLKTVEYTFSGSASPGAGNTTVKSVTVNGVKGTLTADKNNPGHVNWSAKLSNLPVNTPVKISVTAVNDSGKTAVYEGYVYFDSPSLTEEKVFAIYSADDNSLTFYNRTLTATVGNSYNGKTVTEIYTGFDVSSYSAAAETPWYLVRHSVKSVKFEDKIVAPASTAYWFDGFYECTYMNVSNLDVKNVTNMTNMFYIAGRYASELNIVGIENWDTSNVTNMTNMFRLAGSEASFSLDLSGWNVSKVQNMMYMFYGSGCDTIDLSSWDVRNVVFFGYFNKSTNIAAPKWNSVIVIPNGTTEIPADALRSCAEVTTVIVPEGVTTIGKYAFKGCVNLKSITIPDSVKVIEDQAFQECSNLTSVTFSENSQLKSIGRYAFERCAKLTSIVIPGGVTEIGYEAFYKCTALKNIAIPNGVTNLESLFSGCLSLSSVTFDENSQLKVIGQGAFSDCSRLTSITIPVSVKEIDSGAFRNSGIVLINFDGTVNQWRNIYKSSSWCDEMPATEVICSDGVVSLLDK